MKTTISVLNKRGEDATAFVLGVLQSMHTEKISSFKLASFSTVKTAESSDYLRKQSFTSPAIVGCAFSKCLPSNEQQFVKLNNVTMVFEGILYSPGQTPINQVVVKNLPHGDLFKLGEAMLENTEGDFSFLILEKERIIAGRDPLGVRPLYYGENETIAALASSRKALWKLGIEKPQSFPPGNLAVASSRGFEFKPIKTLTYSEPEPMTMQKAVERLQKLLKKAVSVRVAGTKEIAVAFSGGLDSSLVAALAKKCGVDVHLFHVSLENQRETIEAKKAAADLNLPIQTYLFRESDVKTVLPEVVGLIEENDPVKASIGVPIYWVAEKAAEAGFNVLLAGQGADELFGGYQRYVIQHLSHGAEEVRRAIFDDVSRLHEYNIERDVKICSFHDIELRLPFATYQIADFAIKLPLESKIEKKQDSLRKLVLRRVAENMNMPASITEKPKKAVQYATGVNSAIREIAKRQKTTVKEYISRLFFFERKK